MSARERLTQLIDLASGSAPEERHMLAMELAEVLLDWPADYPPHMRTSFTLLLEKIISKLDTQTRRELAARFSSNPASPLALLNELFFDSTRECREAILARNSLENAHDAYASTPVDEAAVIGAARSYPPETFVQTFARLLGLPLVTASRAIADASGEGLAILCKGAGLSRVTFSTIAMLTDASLDSAQRKLEMFDAVPEDASMRMVQFWRGQRSAGTVRVVGIEAA